MRAFRWRVRQDDGAAPALLLIALALTACGGHTPDLSTPEGRCRAEAQSDPQVKDLTARAGSVLLDTRKAAQFQLDRRMSQVVQACLAREGLGRPGGVELPNPQ